MSQWPRRSRPYASMVVVLMALGSGLFAQSAVRQAVGASASDDPDFARAVREWTTRPEFLSPLVDHLPKVAGIPSPKEVLGHHIGEPRKLTYYADILSYYRALADHSPRVRVVPIGKTDESRDLVVVFIGSEESI